MVSIILFFFRKWWLNQTLHLVGLLHNLVISSVVLLEGPKNSVIYFITIVTFFVNEKLCDQQPVLGAISKKIHVKSNSNLLLFKYFIITFNFSCSTANVGYSLLNYILNDILIFKDVEISCLVWVSKSH